MTPTRFSALLPFMLIILFATEAQEKTYTPDELLSLVGQRNGGILASAAAIREADGRLLVAKGAGRPAIDLDTHVSYVAIPTDPVVIDAGSFGTIATSPLPVHDVTVLDASDPLYFSAAVNLNQVLWSWGKVQGAVALRESERNLASAQAVKAMTDASIQLYRSLYSLRARRELLAIVEEQERLARQMLSSIAASRDAGVITGLDYQDAALKVEGLSRTAASLRVAVDSLARDIATLAGIEETGVFAISTEGLAPEPRFEASDLIAWKRKAKVENLDLAVADKAVEASLSAYELSKRSAAGKPDVGANLSFGASGYLPVGADGWEEDDIDLFLNVTIVVKGTLVDFGSSVGTMDSARASADKALAQRGDAERKIDSSIAALYATLEILRGDVEFAERRANWAEAKLADQTVKQDAGTMGDLDLLEARTDYLADVMDLTTKRMNYVDAVLNFLGVTSPGTVVSGEACRL